MDEENNRKLKFLDTLLKQNNGKVSVLVYRKSAHTDQYNTLHYNIYYTICTIQYALQYTLQCTAALTTKQVARKLLFLSCLMDPIPLLLTKTT